MREKIKDKIEKITGKRNNNDKIFKVIFVVSLLVSGPLVWKCMTTESIIGFIEERYISSWIGYYGAIIGGLITFLGVWWTISVNEKNREDDIKNAYLPIPAVLNVETCDGGPLFEVVDDSFNLNGMFVKLKNIGKGPMLKIFFETGDSLFVICDEKKYVPSEYGGCFTKFALEVNEKEKIFLPPIKMSIDRRIMSGEGYKCVYLAHMKYFDAFNREFHLYLKIQYWTCPTVSDREYDCFQIEKEEYERLKKYPEWEIVNKK